MSVSPAAGAECSVLTVIRPTSAAAHTEPHPTTTTQTFLKKIQRFFFFFVLFFSGIMLQNGKCGVHLPPSRNSFHVTEL